MATNRARSRRAKNPRSKQPYLHPDMEPPHIPEIDAAADTYYEAMAERQRLTNEETAAKDNLLSVMKNNGQTRYETPDGLIVIVLSTEAVKCKKKKDKELELNGDQ
jgi:hypothetical protein